MILYEFEDEKLTTENSSRITVEEITPMLKFEGNAKKKERNGGTFR